MLAMKVVPSASMRWSTTANLRASATFAFFMPARLATRTSAESSLRTWGLKLKERIGFKRAAVAVARKLAVVMHATPRSGQLFDRTAGMAA